MGAKDFMTRGEITITADSIMHESITSIVKPRIGGLRVADDKKPLIDFSNNLNIGARQSLAVSIGLQSSDGLSIPLGGIRTGERR